MATHNLSGDWNGAFIEQSGNQVTAAPDWTKINRASAPWTEGNGKLIGNSLTMTFQGGLTLVPYTVEGSVAEDGGSIKWGNGTRWTKLG